MQPEAHQLIRKLRPLLRRGGQPTKALVPLLKAGLRYAPEWGWRENILGFALSLKDEQPCLTLFVRRKLHRARLTKKQFIPDAFRVAALNRLELRTDVIEAGSFQLHSVAPGVSLAHEHAHGPGTLGAILSRDNDRFLLSCAHVLALARRDESPEQPDDFIEMPFEFLSDPESHRVATLIEGFTPLTQLREPDSDFALARLRPGVEFDTRFSGGRHITALSPRERVADFPDGHSLTLFGRNGATPCRVRFSDAVLRTPARGHTSISEWIYRGLAGYEGQCRPGDSGGALLEAGDVLAGIHVGGFDGEDLGFFYPTSRRLRELQLDPA